MNNRGLLLFLAVVTTVNAFAQMHVKKPNLSTFRKDNKESTAVLDKHSSAAAKKHPEYGVLPYNAQCTGCVELLDQRTMNSRQFIDAYDANHTYSQQSYYPLHYKKDSADVWHTVDQRLRPTTTPGVYVAENQPVPTKYDLNSHTASLKVRGFEFEFNKHLSMYYYDENSMYTQREPANYTSQSVGEEGTYVRNIFNGLDMEQVYRAGEIKTNFLIPAPLQIPIAKGWMVIEDRFTLPQGYNFVEAKGGNRIAEGNFFRGDYVITNAEGEVMVTYEKPVYVDGMAFGMHGIYNLLQNGNDYTLQMLIPVEWLTRKDNTYPLIIDPVVHGETKIGDFTQTGLPSASMGFTTINLGACTYAMNVTVPGNSKLTNAYVDVEYTLTYDNSCGNPPLPAPFCTFSQATMEVQCDACNTTTGPLSCRPGQPPYTGTCTTDSNLVPGARAILINSFVPNYLTCIPAQCPDYHLGFTLLNRDSTCGDQCGYLCARGNMWRMTIEACRVQGFITQNKTRVCADEPVTFTAHPDCGVPPYHYQWTVNGGSDTTIFGSADFVVRTSSDAMVSCVIIDNCGEIAVTNDLNDTIIPTPPANAGIDAQLCPIGGTVQLGGTPTTTPGSTVLWNGENATVSSWLSSNNIFNPVATVPAGVVDTFYYLLRASNGTCSRYDTVYIRVTPAPVATIDTSGSTTVCANQNVTISVVEPFASYLWNTGSTTQSINANQPGNYFAIVTDANGCKDTTGTITITGITVPTVNVFPDTLIIYGDSVMLTTDLNLNSAIVDSFMWSPDINISCTYCTNPVVSPQNDQYYSVIVHASGCTISDSALVRVILPNNYFIPNAFSPNGDGNNDNFYIQAQSGVKVLLFQVFNRIGEKVHEGNYPWDGTYKGKPVQPGVYIYVFKLGLFGEDFALFRKGSVTLIK
jgi:gliding motility-associated-like protein